MFNISFPKNIPTTNRKVSGICPDLKLVSELSKINIKTIPLAPISPVENKVILSKPVTNAVIVIISTRFLVPYFSSSIGPSNKISVRLPNRCPQPPCPMVCENSRKYDKGSSHDMPGDTLKKASEIPGKV